MSENHWFSLGRTSGLNPMLAATGDNLNRPPPLPPGPPDNQASFDSQFPLLSAVTNSTVQSPRPPMQTSLVETASKGQGSAISVSSLTTVTRSAQTESFTQTTEVEMTQTYPSSPDLTIADRSEILTTVQTLSPRTDIKHFTVVPPKSSSPLLTNNASAGPSKVHLSSDLKGDFESLSIPATSPFIPKTSLPVKTKISTTTADQTIPKKPPPATFRPPPNSIPLTWAQRTKHTVDNSLKRVAPVSYSATGTPQVVVPDEVFQRGALCFMSHNGLLSMRLLPLSWYPFLYGQISKESLLTSD